MQKAPERRQPIGENVLDYGLTKQIMALEHEIIQLTQVKDAASHRIRLAKQRLKRLRRLK